MWRYCGTHRRFSIETGLTETNFRPASADSPDTTRGVRLCIISTISEWFHCRVTLNFSAESSMIPAPASMTTKERSCCGIIQKYGSATGRAGNHEAIRRIAVQITFASSQGIIVTIQAVDVGPLASTHRQDDFPGCLLNRLVRSCRAFTNSQHALWKLAKTLNQAWCFSNHATRQFSSNATSDLLQGGHQVRATSKEPPFSLSNAQLDGADALLTYQVRRDR